MHPGYGESVVLEDVSFVLEEATAWRSSAQWRRQDDASSSR